MSADAGVRYRDKVTIVTGGSRGIGRGCVELFARHGSKVVIADIKDNLANELFEELTTAKVPGQAIFIECDVMNEVDIKNLVEKTVDTFGRIDCLINNAGTNPGYSTTDTCSVEDFRWLMELNLVAPFQISKYAIKYLREAKGNIINIASMSGVLGQGHVMPYTTSKSRNDGNFHSQAGLIGLTKTMAVDESKYGVRVNCISPSSTDTPMFRDKVNACPNPEKSLAFSTSHLQYMGRLCQPEDVARACLYLATDATYSTGQNIYVSGGCELDYGFKANMDFFFQ